MLVKGLIPAHTECPYRGLCKMTAGCHHQGVEHPVPFSCGMARFLKVVVKEMKEKRNE